MKKERWGDPQIQEEQDEIDNYLSSTIIINGQLTDYGEELYEQSREYHFDEISGEWIII